MEAPAADSHAVFVEAPVHHVRHQRHAGRRRQKLARHRLGDVPDLVVDDGPEHDAGAAGKLERWTVDDGGIIATLARNHGIGHQLAPYTVIPGRERSERTRNPDTNSACVSGFRARRFAAPRNDGECHAPSATRKPTSRSSVAVSSLSVAEGAR